MKNFTFKVVFITKTKTTSHKQPLFKTNKIILIYTKTETYLSISTIKSKVPYEIIKKLVLPKTQFKT